MSDRTDQMVKHLTESTEEGLMAELAGQLEGSSPRIGAQGPTDPGPEERYVKAIRKCAPDVRAKCGQAVNQLLLQESISIARTGNVERRFLLFNLLALLEDVALPGVLPGLGALRESEELLRASLAPENADAFRQLLRALAVSQKGDKERAFWLGMLSEASGRKYADIAAMGLRRCGWEAGLEALPEVKAAYEANPDLGSFESVVRVLIDTHPEATWPQCAESLGKNPLTQDIWNLIQKYSRGRYLVSPGALPPASGTAADDLLKRVTDPERMRKIRPWQGQQDFQAYKALSPPGREAA